MLKKAFVYLLFFTFLALFFQNCAQPSSLVSNANANASSLELVNVDGSYLPPESGSQEGTYTTGTQINDQDCPNISISDIYLRIQAVETDSEDLALEIIDDTNSISVNKKYLFLRSLISESLSEINLILDEKNYILSSDQQTFELQSNSAVPALKVKLTQPIQLNAGQEYKIEFNLNLGSQTYTTERKCLLKPVIESATLSLR